jgi:hypothetical protein
MSVMVPVLILKLTWLDHQRPARSRQDRKSRGAHQPLNAIDDKVPRADVEDFKLEKLRSFAGRAESQPVVQINGDGRAGRFHEPKNAASVGSRAGFHSGKMHYWKHVGQAVHETESGTGRLLHLNDRAVAILSTPSHAIPI